ncbi:DOT1-domain-containing protein [Trichodelitschia bisporula]|uniref:Histone-lysine N-methyltransferase, H3 lysine-79 specific n=1 Tax=Trichodelitschia bisporula TaxID=703511 RepID=A0A6G1HLP9_9PEZI|nr:DOT1-domain-containing protein [Trichodelitschia bisporula]
MSKKRKLPEPVVPQWGEDSDDNEDDDFTLESLNKRLRHSPRDTTLEPDTERVLYQAGKKGPRDRKRDRDRLKGKEDKEQDEQRGVLIHSSDLTASQPDYERVFEGEGDVPEIVLQYPSFARTETFALVTPRDSNNYKPIDDIINTVEQILLFYLPPDLAAKHTNELTGFPRRLRRAVHDLSLDKFTAAVRDFNTLIRTSLLDETIQRHMSSVRALPFALTEHILGQTYMRTVSPAVHLLKQYENGTDNVYGELLPRFAAQIFHDTALSSRHTFVDLGSGVANVVLHAALQSGAEAWGIEVMPNPARMAAEQVREFRARCLRWGLVPGRVRVIQGDFLACPEIDTALRGADVVLVNNQAFFPALNDALLMKFLDLKEGCRVVSLKSFVPDKWVTKRRNVEDPRNLLTVERREYWSGFVSWTDAGGTYFVAKKDSGRLRAFLDGGGAGSD